MATKKKVVSRKKKVNKVKEFTEVDDFFIKGNLSLPVEELANKLCRTVEEITERLKLFTKTNTMEKISGMVAIKNQDGTAGALVYTERQGLKDDNIQKNNVDWPPGKTRLGVITGN